MASRPAQMRVLIVRLSALGDIVHALPLAAALRRSMPRARIDWLVDRRYADVLRLVSTIDQVIEIDATSPAGWWRSPGIVARLRRRDYDAALDPQGLGKSALLARASGARRVIGLPTTELRERWAAPLYTERCDTRSGTHVIERNLALAAGLIAPGGPLEFGLSKVPMDDAADRRAAMGLDPGEPYVALNPGAAWPNKRWPAARFAALASGVRARHGLRSVVLWGPNERALADEVAGEAAGAALVAPPTSVEDLAAAIAGAVLLVSGDTGPLHLGAAVGTPIVGVYGPTDPMRNGPWAEDDTWVSRFDACRCHYRRRCRVGDWCLAEITVPEVESVVDRRLAARPNRV